MLVHIENLVKRYGDLLALDHLSLDIEEGEIFGLLGPNGSGKTTAINCLLALLKYDKGTITIFGKDMKPDSYDIKQDIGVVMQNVAVFEQMSVYENIDYFCGLYIKDKQLRRQYVEEAIEFVGLSDYKKFYPKKLSGGLLRRLNIACGIAHKPKLIFLDEPTVGLDPEERGNFRTVLTNISSNRIILLSTHIVQDIEYVANEIIIMKQGKILVSGSRNNILKSVEEKIWECDDIEKNNHVILCNQRNENDKIISRVISNECPGENAKKVSPCLDDVYLYFNALESYKEL